ncbi:MAG: BrnT family toxin [Bacillota bacterium]
MRITRFEWDQSNVTHIERHRVTVEEAEETLREDPVSHRTRLGRLVAYGRTSEGRYLTVVLIIKRRSVARVITARPMTKAERKYYARRRR